MYWNPFDSAHSGRINSSSGWAAILGFILALVGCGIFFFLTAGGTRVQAVIHIIRESNTVNNMKLMILEKFSVIRTQHVPPAHAQRVFIPLPLAARCFRPPPALLPRPSRRRRHSFPPPPQTIRCSRYSSGRTPNSARASTHLRGTTSPSVTCAAYGRRRGRYTTRSSSSSTIDVGMAGVSVQCATSPPARYRTMSSLRPPMGRIVTRFS